MPRVFHSYNEFVRGVCETGQRIKPRGLPTFELTGTEFVFESNKMFYRPGMNTALGWAELLMLLAGVYDPKFVRYAAPRADMLLYNPRLMYGPRVITQYSGLVAALTADHDTREAVLVIGSSLDGSTGDQPCTVSIQFMVRGDRLNAYVSMRSQDLVKGLPYDCIMFGGLTQAIAAEIGVHPGVVTVRHGSAHVYTSDYFKGMLPISERVREYKVRVPLLSAIDNARDILDTDWKPTPDIVECGDWKVVD